MNQDEDDESNRELVEVNSVEGEVLVIDRVQGSSNYSSLHLGTLGQILREHWCTSYSGQTLYGY